MHQRTEGKKGHEMTDRKNNTLKSAPTMRYAKFGKVTPANTKSQTKATKPARMGGGWGVPSDLPIGFSSDRFGNLL